MNIGLLDTTTVVAKDFMVQPNMPRYLRKGDKAVVSATCGKARCLSFANVQTPAVLFQTRSCFQPYLTLGMELERILIL